MHKIRGEGGRTDKPLFHTASDKNLGIRKAGYEAMTYHSLQLHFRVMKCASSAIVLVSTMNLQP